MKDITEIFCQYRECARHIWNQYFRFLQDGLDCFYNVQNELFDSLVLVQIGIFDWHRNSDEPLNRVLLAPNPNLESLQLYFDQSSDQIMHTYKVETISVSSLKLAFIDFFDWDEQGFRDFTFVRAMVLE